MTKVLMSFASMLLLVAVSGPATAKGKPGGGGGTDLGIPAVGLGLPAGCPSTADVYTHGLGDDGATASTVSVVAGIQECEKGSPPQPYLWSNGTWQDIDVPIGQTGGMAKDVSEAGDIVGDYSGAQGTAFVLRSGADVEALPKGGFHHSNTWDISNNGRFVAGGVASEVSGEISQYAALWSWNGTAWSLRILGEAIAA